MSIDTIKYRGHTISVDVDNDPINPREDCDNLSKMVCFHKRYSLGDEHELVSEDYDGWEEMEEHLRKEGGAVIVLPLALYDHGGITMYVGSPTCQFDSGQVGFIYCTRQDILKWENRKHLSAKLLASVEERLRSDVKVYDQYLRGEVYGYAVEGPNCDDSCYGFFDMDYMIEEAKSNIDHSILQLELPGFEKAY